MFISSSQKFGLGGGAEVAGFSSFLESCISGRVPAAGESGDRIGSAEGHGNDSKADANPGRDEKILKI